MHVLVGPGGNGSVRGSDLRMTRAAKIVLCTFTVLEKLGRAGAALEPLARSSTKIALCTFTALDKLEGRPGAALSVMESPTHLLVFIYWAGSRSGWANEPK